METATVTSIITRARRKADAETPTPTVDHTTDAELLDELNAGYKELLELIIGTGDAALELLLTDATLTSPYALPADFYRLAAVEIPDTVTTWRALKQFSFRQRNDYIDTQYPRYRVLGQVLTFSPADAAPSSVRIWYIPVFSPVSSGGSITSFNGWDDFLVGHLAAYIAEKEDRDPTPGLRLKGNATTRVLDACAQLVVGDTQTLAEVEHQWEDIFDLV